MSKINGPLQINGPLHIATYLRQGLSKNQIAKQLNRSHTPVLREISRNTGGSGCRYKQAHVFAGQRHGTKNKATKLNDSIKKLIAKYIKLDWSPEQVCGRLSRDNIINLHHETVYRYILKNKQHNGKLYKHLRHQVKAYRKRYGYPNNRGAIPNRTDIDQRPWAVNNRLVFGHWEADTVIGKDHQGRIVTKIRLAYPVDSRHMNKVSAAILVFLNKLTHHCMDKFHYYQNHKELIRTSYFFCNISTVPQIHLLFLHHNSAALKKPYL